MLSENPVIKNVFKKSQRYLLSKLLLLFTNHPYNLEDHDYDQDLFIGGQVVYNLLIRKTTAEMLGVYKVVLETSKELIKEWKAKLEKDDE